MRDNVESGGAFNRKLFFGLLVLVIVSSTVPWTGNSFPNRHLGYAMTFIFLSIMAYYFIKHHDLILPTNGTSVLIYIILSIYIIHLLTSPYGGNWFDAAIVRVPIFIMAILCFVYMLPRALSWAHILFSLSFISAGIIMISAPTLFGFSYNISLFTFEPYRITARFVIDTGIPRLQGPFFTPNAMGMLALAGTMASLFLFQRMKTLFHAGVLSINSMGLFFSGSRGAIVAGLVGITIYILMLVFREGSLKYALLLPIISLLVLLPIEIYTSSISEFIGSINWSGRITLTIASMEATMDKPVIGYGTGSTSEHIEPYVDPNYRGDNPHNSYARMFLTTGIFGGSAYIALHLKVILLTLSNYVNRESAEISAFVVALAVNQLTQQYSIFGLNSSSIIAATVVGYSIYHIMSKSFPNTRVR